MIRWCAEDSHGHSRTALREASWRLRVTEIAPGIYRLSTYNVDANFMFNQFLVVNEEPLLFQTGLRSLFRWSRTRFAV